MIICVYSALTNYLKEFLQLRIFATFLLFQEQRPICTFPQLRLKVTSTKQIQHIRNSFHFMCEASVLE